MSKNIPVSKLIIDTAPPENEIAAMVVSLQDVGMIHPIQVIPDGKKFKVIAGRTRATAARALKWSNIRADIRPATSDEEIANSEMVEIDENLFRRNMSPAAEALLVGRRKALYDKLHPDLGHGGDRKSEDRPTGQTFTEHQARMTGRSRRSIQRVAKRAEIGDDLLAKIPGTSLDDGRQLDALIKLPPEERTKMVEAAVRGERVNANAEARKLTQHERRQEIIDSLKITNRVEVILADCAKMEDSHIESLAADNAVVCLWASGSVLTDAFGALRRLGFTPKAHMIWAHGDSDDVWLAYNHHVLIIATRGTVDLPSTRESSVLTGKPGLSGYPEDLFKVVFRMFKGRTKLQLIDSRNRSGWETRAPVLEAA